MQVDIQIGMKKSTFALVAAIMRLAATAQVIGSSHGDALQSALVFVFGDTITTETLDYSAFTTEVYAKAISLESGEFYDDRVLVDEAMHALQIALAAGGLSAKITAWQMAG